MRPVCRQLKHPERDEYEHSFSVRLSRRICRVMYLILIVYFISETNFDCQVFLGRSLAAERFSAELIGGINHVNYNQNNSLNAFAGECSVFADY